MLKKSTIVIKNKRAAFDYEILDRYVAGIQLFGTEITVDLREEDINIDTDLNDQMTNKEEELND